MCKHSPSDMDDISAPHGRCTICNRPFGMRDKNDFVVFKFDTSNVCTECVILESDEYKASIRYQYDQWKRSNE